MISANLGVADKAEEKMSLNIENYADYYLQNKHMNFMLLTPHFLSHFIAIINQFYISGKGAFVITKLQNL